MALFLCPEKLAYLLGYTRDKTVNKIATIGHSFTDGVITMSPKLDDYTDKAGIAELIGVSPRTLDRWWNERRGPPRVKLGHKVLYHRPAVLAWVKSQEQSPVRSRMA